MSDTNTKSVTISIEQYTAMQVKLGQYYQALKDVQIAHSAGQATAIATSALKEVKL